MAGLLDFLNTPDGQGLLSAAFGGLAGARTGQPINSIGRAGLAGLSGYVGAQDREQQNATDAMRNKYMQSQIDDNVSKNAQMVQALAATQKRENFFMGDGTGAGGQASQSPNALPPSAFTPSLGGMGPIAPMSERPAPQAQSGGKFDEWSRQYGIPVDALKTDFYTNGGKGIPDMLMKRGAPDMQVSNGYAYDKNKQGAGYLPSLSTSQDGKTSMVQIGADGQPVISAPQGALSTFNAYQGAQANFKPIKVFNPETQREEFTNEGAVVGGPGQALPDTATAAGSFQKANPGAKLITPRPGESDASQIYAGALTSARQQLATARTPEDAARARSDIAGIQGEMGRAGIRSAAPSGNFAAGPSANESAMAEGLKTRVADSGKAGTARIMTGYEGALSASDMLISNAEARKSISGGSFQGAGAETKLAISKALNGLGFSVAPDQVTNTDYLQSTLGQGILNKAKTLGANPTDADARIIRAIVGSIGTDPRALDKLLDHQDVMANRAIDSHNRNYTQAKSGGFDAGYNLFVDRPGGGATPAGAPAAAMDFKAAATAELARRKAMK